MVRLFSHKNRPVHLGGYPLERLRRQKQASDPGSIPQPKALQIEQPGNRHSLANGMREYVNVMDRMRVGDVAPNKAPIPDDLQERTDHLKAACYYLDASMVGVCKIAHDSVLKCPIINEFLSESMEQEYGVGSADNPMAEISVREGKAAWERAQALMGQAFNHETALAIVVEYTRDVEPGESGESWIAGTQSQRASLRAAEVGGVMANYLRMLGFDARLHTATASDLDANRILLAAGLGEVAAAGGLTVPYLGERYGVAIVSTSLE